jgi:hypothetical protein
MQFEPKTDKEIQEMNLFEPGEYDFQVLEAHDAFSAKGNEMIKLKLLFTNDEGRQQIIFDYLMAAIPHKLKHACDCIGHADKYASGSILAEDFINKSGCAKIFIQKDRTGQYPDKNAVADYIVDKVKGQAKQAPISHSSDVLDDDIPF